jgi:hypothetical protein
VGGDGQGHLVVSGIQHGGHADLPEVCRALALVAALDERTGDGNADRRESHEDRDHDEHFDQGESPAGMFGFQCWIIGMETGGRIVRPVGIRNGWDIKT